MPPKISLARSSRKSQVTDEEKQLDKIVEELHESEFKERNEVKLKIYGSIKGTDNLDKLSDDHIDLVLLARALNGVNDICTATVITADQKFLRACSDLTIFC